MQPKTEQHDLTDKTKVNASLNPDPITHAPGAHPVGAGVGAAAGGAVAAGALAGSILGPIGTAVGALVGGLAGGLLGKGVAEAIHPTAEHEYWEKEHPTRPYVAPGTTFDQYAPAYKHGWEARAEHSGKSFEEVETALGKKWETARGNSPLQWEHARPAVRDAWDRVDAKVAPSAAAATAAAEMNASSSTAATSTAALPTASTSTSTSPTTGVDSASSAGVISDGMHAQQSATPTPDSHEQVSHEHVEVRAYYISLSGNGASQDDNWFRAERESQNG